MVLNAHIRMLLPLVAIVLAACPGERPRSLVLAAHAGDLAAVRSLIAEGADPNALDRDVTPLFAAVVADRDEVARYLLEAGARLGERMPSGPAPSLLHHLAGGGGVRDPGTGTPGTTWFTVAGPPGSPEGARALVWLERLLATAPDAADALRMDADGFGTPLHAAAARGACEAVRALLEAGADPTLPGAGVVGRGGTPLVVAMLAGHPACISALASISPRPGEDACRRWAILRALYTKVPREIRPSLIETLASRPGHTAESGTGSAVDGVCRPALWRDLRSSDAARRAAALDALTPERVREVHGGATLADVAVWERDAELVARLRAMGAAPAGEMLVRAADDGWREGVREVLPESPQDACAEAARVAGQKARTAVLGLLLHARCPASPAAWSQAMSSSALDVSALEVFVRAGAEVDAPSEFGETALHRAARAGDAEVVEWLLARGADPRRPIDPAATPVVTAIDCAEAAGHAELAARLRAFTKPAP